MSAHNRGPIRVDTVAENAVWHCSCGAVGWCYWFTYEDPSADALFDLALGELDSHRLKAAAGIEELVG